MVCLTFDIEERFHSHLTPEGSERKWELEGRIASILDYLEENQKQATFFVVGELAEHYPSLIQRMSNSGFEVASHSYSHLHFYQHDNEKVKDDITRSKDVLEGLTGKPVLGFRAPSWSAQISDTWLWEHLASLGFKYDSSLFPIKTHLYGSNQNPLEVFKVHSELVEIPPSANELMHLRIPYGGGFYFRLYPVWFTKWLMKRSQKIGQHTVLYFHPWEFDVASAEIEKRMIDKFIGNYNLKNNWSRWQAMLQQCETTSMSDYYDTLGDISKNTVPDSIGSD